MGGDSATTEWWGEKVGRVGWAGLGGGRDRGTKSYGGWRHGDHGMHRVSVRRAGPLTCLVGCVW